LELCFPFTVREGEEESKRKERKKKLTKALTSGDNWPILAEGAKVLGALTLNWNLELIYLEDGKSSRF